MNPLLTPKEAAMVLNVSVDYLGHLVAAGELPYVAIGMGEKRQRRRFAKADIEAFIGDRKCLHSSETEKQPTPTTSKSGVVDIQAILAKRRNVKPTALKQESSKTSGKR